MRGQFPAFEEANQAGYEVWRDQTVEGTDYKLAENYALLCDSHDVDHSIVLPAVGCFADSVETRTQQMPQQLRRSLWV